ncbi:MAG: DUF6077 domain-containing protein [Candidatus Saccharimonadales bacterium]
MSETTITPMFLLHLFATTSILIALFYSYGLLAKRHIAPQLQSIAGGFVLFLAVNELLALPFILNHLAFYAFYAVFLALNTVVLIYGLVIFIKKIRDGEIAFKKPSLMAIFAIISLLVSIGLAQFYVKYDADDAFYVSLTEQSIGTDQLYLYDPSTGNAEFPISKAYIFQSWELLQASMAHSFQLTAVEFAHSLIPMLIMILVFSAHKYIYKDLLRSDEYTYLALLLLFIFLLFSGFSIYSQGSFLMTRSWQGKAILAALILPMLLNSLLATYNRPDNKEAYISIGVLLIAGMALNPAIIFLGATPIGVFGALTVIKYRNFSSALKLSATLLPVIIMGVAAKLMVSSGVGGSLDPKILPDGRTYGNYLQRFIGGTRYLYVVLLGACLSLKKKIDMRIVTLVIIFPAALFATILNPLLFEPLYTYITTNTYWRLFWIIPITIMVPIAGVHIYSFINEAFARILPKAVDLTRIGVIVAVSLVYIGAGTFIYSHPDSTFDNSRHKAPVGVSEVANELTEQPQGVILAASSPAVYLHNFTSKHQLLVSRKFYIPSYHPAGTTEYNELRLMFNIINNTDTHSISQDRFMQLLKKYKVDYMISPQRNTYIKSFATEFSLDTIFKSEYYSVYELN